LGVFGGSKKPGSSEERESYDRNFNFGTKVALNKRSKKIMLNRKLLPVAVVTV